MASKTIIIDPNNTNPDRTSFNSNIPIPLEDLTISVQLETERKARTVLTVSNQGGAAQSTDAVTLRIIEGETINSEHQLTTNYTDLTTVFDSSENAQSIGISSIDIDFNSSYAPLINITFIDVRGGAIFQNEGNISGANSRNKYSVFFELPYPIFTLTIKGYYGKPVQYCLHMTKWTTRFNSHTGNFEITANFIGYTYAMLSDLLVGFLKAIAFTTKGEAAYKAINDEREAANTDKQLKPILTLSGLQVAISQINDSIAKLAATDPNTAVIDSANKKSEILATIQDVVTLLGTTLENDSGTLLNNQEQTSYTYVVTDHVEAPQVKMTNSYQQDVQDKTLVDNSAALNRINSVYTQTTNSQNGSTNTSNAPKNSYMSRMLITSDYKTKIDDNINAYNNLGQPQLDNTIFSLDKVLYQDITIDELNPDNETTETPETRNKLASKLQCNSGDSNEFKTKRASLYNYLMANYSAISTSKKLDIYELTEIYNKLEEERKKLTDSIVESTRKLAEVIKSKIGSTLGFEPSVRQMVEVFTTAAEVFMGVLYDVSHEAESDIPRGKELKNTFPLNDNTDIVGVDSAAQKYYAWPDYREYDAVNGYTEKYLGAARNLKNPKNITELKFIDELLDAFIKASKAEAMAQNQLADKQTNWLPSNPLDTRIFTDISPYNRMKCVTPDDVLTLMLIRAITFLGYTNSNSDLSEDYIIKFAKAEANAVAKAFSSSDILLKAIKNTTPDKILGTRNKINGTDRNVLYKFSDSNGSYYSLDYVFPSQTTNSYQMIPLTSDFKGDWEKTLTNDAKFSQSILNTLELDLKSTVNNDFEGLIRKGGHSVFLSNYSSMKELVTGVSSIPISKGLDKLIDGAIYVRIITPSDYQEKSNQLIEDIDTKNIIDLTELKKVNLGIKAAGFNPFGGIYGIQEFSKLNWGDDKITLPLNFVFYDGYNVNYAMFNGLGRDRGSSSSDSTNNYKLSELDKVDSQGKLKKNTLDISKQDALELVNGNNDNNSDKLLHKDFGKNINLFNDMIGGDKTITYPYVNQRVLPEPGLTKSTTDPSDLYVFSLFGSLLYYAQDKSKYPQHAKALLFLNTLPWNGRLFSSPEISNLFKHNASFIQAPRLWCAYIGGLIWRYNLSEDPIQWVSGQTANQTSIAPNQFSYLPIATSGIPRKDTFFDVLAGEQGTSVYDEFGWKVGWFDKEDYSHLIYSLPQQARLEFVKIFTDFVEGNSSYISWRQIAEQLEVWTGTSDAFKTYFDNVYANEKTETTIEYLFFTNSKTTIDTNTLLSPLANVDNYRIITPIYSFNYSLFLELNGNYSNNLAVKNIINSMTDAVIIANASPEVWNSGLDGSTPITNMYQTVASSEDKLNLYLKNFLDTIPNETGTVEEKKKEEQALFNTADENQIKLMLYRHCKNIYDKWLGGVTEKDNIMFQCGSRNSLDDKLKTRYRGENTKTLRLIDSFRFVSRSFRDIGDELYVNPIPINTHMVENPNASFYDIVGSFLADNDFDFIALPTYINFKNEEELANAFKPYPDFREAFAEMDAGPSFVCVYVGQKSKHLDIKGSSYPNDGFDFIDAYGNISNSMPRDFNNAANDYENTVPVFAVNYSQQNQSFFKDIVLDQGEFTETAESLQIMDDIASKGAENNRTFGGQNMYNVYSVRSYKTEIEMLGNAVVQPMMYFQLNNIPMFHGAYMITRVKHSIKPNFMSTHFTGVRVRGPETQLFTAVDLYMNLLASIDLSVSSGGNGALGTNNAYVNAGSFPNFNSTIVPDTSITGNDNKKFIDPVGNAKLSSFINRGGTEIHEGIDIGIPVGSDAYAITDGHVELVAFNNGGYGLYLVVNHGVLGDDKKVYKTVYGHMSYIPANILNFSSGHDSKNLTESEINQLVGGVYNPNVRVKKKDILGKTGGNYSAGIYLDPTTKKYNTAGLSTGDHLHFELRVGEENEINTPYKLMKYVDPLLYIPLGQDPKYAYSIAKSSQTDPDSVSRVATPTETVRLKLLDTLKTWA